MSSCSLFLKDRFSDADIERVLADNFRLKPDPHGYGWVAETMPGRDIVVEDGTNDTFTMPDDMVKMAARNLGSRFLPAKPKTRLVLISADWDDDPERRAVFAVGWAFAEHTRAVMEDHTGRQTVFPAGGWKG